MTSPAYRPLNSAEGEIRVLILLHGPSHDADIHCELKTVNLSDNPVYEALSYTWGSVGKADQIRLNGDHKLPVWENAGAALRRLRLPKKPRHLWIDAICINQNDVQERSQQVLLMQRIYGHAEQVIVWLGELTDSGILAMKELQGKVWSVGWHQWKIDRKFGKPTLPWTEQFTTSRGIVNRDDLVGEHSNGEVYEVLDRPWWRRTWIIQEAVLARGVTIMCGAETVGWESVDTFFKQLPVHVGDRIEAFGLPINTKDGFPETLYRIISDYRNKWRAEPDTVRLLDVLYRFRRLECTDARDKIYGFLGIVPGVVDIGLVPDYSSSVADVYLSFARRLINKTGSLDVLNCRREWQHGDAPTAARPAQAYSILDQARFYDVHALIKDAPDEDATTRRGWARLPDGWERIVVDAKKTVFRDHNTGTVHDTSPLEGTPARLAEYYTKQRVLPSDWVKRWDNLGRQTVEHQPSKQTPPLAESRKRDEQLRSYLSELPSWVPNWASPTRWDPEPLIDLQMPNGSQFWAGGKDSVATPLENKQGSRVLSLEGVIFDKIKHLAPAWHPEGDIAPLSRKSNEVLVAWEALGLQDVAENCPYTNTKPTTVGGSPRANALWRTMIADHAGDGAAPDDDWFYVETWYDRAGWAQDPPDLTSLGILSSTLAEFEVRSQENDMLYSFIKLDPSRYPEFGVKMRQSHQDGKVIIARYGEYLRRIFRACAHRALFVTEKGYIGLAPWNAKEGDEVAVVRGGRTPFLFRRCVDDGEVEDSGRFTLIGETYVYGIMGGEALVDRECGEKVPRTTLHVC
ncbi:heterokaryon incompatibility protein-domain-containing protein [Apodospora peruviana]|uniref:Heterokaryon incompatibility protein-domain-containing protein n=1 Tax=Apodospora peruviana TaxID=516989 RepID=A0AAE0HTD4_9PEZI|nr:heterokaryon incompatibility protein-domain-containing protein [Apodospora peruviana]